MTRLLGWLHCPSWGLLVVAAVLLGLSPFSGEPHLIEKMRVLMRGGLVRPIDLLDLVWHAWPMAWMMLRLLTPSAAAHCRLPVR